MMASPLVLDPVEQSLKLTAGHPIEEARARLAKKINATVGKDGLLRLDVLADAPIEAQSTGNAVIDTWVKSTLPGEPDPADMEKRFEFAKTSLESIRRFQSHIFAEAGASLSKPLSRSESGRKHNWRVAGPLPGGGVEYSANATRLLARCGVTDANSPL